MKIKSILFGLVFLIYVPLLTGCEMKDPIIKEMEIAEEATYKQKKATSKEKHAAITLAVQKYFPLGMKKKDALILLNKLYEDGFEIREHIHGGVRIWPKKDFFYHSNVNLEKQFPHGTVGYVVEKLYDRVNLILTRTAVILIKFDSNDIIVESEGRINNDGL